jgi:hypothetical protein
VLSLLSPPSSCIISALLSANSFGTLSCSNLRPGLRVLVKYTNLRSLADVNTLEVNSVCKQNHTDRPKQSGLRRRWCNFAEARISSCGIRKMSGTCGMNLVEPSTIRSTELLFTVAPFAVVIGFETAEYTLWTETTKLSVLRPLVSPDQSRYVQ